MKESRTYQCAMCRKVFDFDDTFSEKEMMNEYEELFSDFQGDDMMIVCDDCFQKVNPRASQGNREQYDKAAAEFKEANKL